LLAGKEPVWTRIRLYYLGLEALAGKTGTGVVVLTFVLFEG